jgi:hypothetical protein
MVLLDCFMSLFCSFSILRQYSFDSLPCFTHIADYFLDSTKLHVRMAMIMCLIQANRFSSQRSHPSSPQS